MVHFMHLQATLLHQTIPKHTRMNMGYIIGQLSQKKALLSFNLLLLIQIKKGQTAEETLVLPFIVEWIYHRCSRKLSFSLSEIKFDLPHVVHDC